MDAADLTALIDAQADAVRIFMEPRYLPCDVTVAIEDRYDGLRGLLDLLA